MWKDSELQEILTEKQWTFSDYVQANAPKIIKCKELLSQPIPEETDPLVKHIATLSSKLDYLTECLAYGKAFRDLAKNQRITRKDKDKTDLDRETLLGDALHRENLFIEVLEGTINSLDKYLSQAQSTLAIKRAELQRFGSNE